MPLDIKNSISWSLVISAQRAERPVSLSFQQPLFSHEEDFGDDGLQLLDYLQEVYYVTKLEVILDNGNLHNNKILLDNQDNGWDVLSNVFANLYPKIYRSQGLLSSNSSYPNSSQLLHLKGEAYGDYIRNTMGGVYPFRYEIYTSLKHIIPMSLRRRYKLARCTDIVCDSQAFQRFFNLSLQWIETTQRNLQTYENDALEKLLIYLSRRKEGMGDFKKRYLKNDRRCFSKTLVFNGATYLNLLCFSGAQEPTGQLKKAMESIAQCGLFGNCHLVKVPVETRYMLSDTKYITLGDAILSGLYDVKQHGRMFSCCERKTFAHHNWTTCKAFRMIVRFAPCELCERLVESYRNNFHGVVVYGKKLAPLKKRKEFDSLADNIYRKLHPLLLP